jgi:hypothetical protein
MLICKDVRVNKPQQSFSLAFGKDHNISFIQDIEAKPEIEGRDIRYMGEVIIRRSGEGTPGPSLVIDITTNDENIDVKTEFNDQSQSALVTVPRRLQWDGRLGPCARIKATLWVPGDGVLDTVSVQSVHLGIKLLDNLNLKVERQTQLTTLAEDIIAGVGRTDDSTTEWSQAGVSASPFNLDSRWIMAKTTSGGIFGSWPLYDYLGMASTSGRIKIGVEPKASSAGLAKPALLYIKTFSGGVELKEPIYEAQAGTMVSAATAAAYIPARDYLVNIQTTSGGIKGSLAFGSSCRFHSTSGDINMNLLPAFDIAHADDAEAYASLETFSTSGTTTINLLDPLWIDMTKGALVDSKPGGAVSPPSPPSAPLPRESSAQSSPRAEQADQTGAATMSSGRMMRCLKSRHSATSANVKLSYPASYEGDMELQSTAGKLTVYGDGVQVIKAGKDWPGANKQIVARKGLPGGCLTQIKTTSGDQFVHVG